MTEQQLTGKGFQCGRIESSHTLSAPMNPRPGTTQLGAAPTQPLQEPIEMIQSRQSYTCLTDFLLPMKRRLLSTFPPHSASWPTLGPVWPCVAWHVLLLFGTVTNYLFNVSCLLICWPHSHLNNNKTYLFTFYLLLSDWKNYKT